MRIPAVRPVSARSASEQERGGLGLPIAIFASAQFVMVLDSSVMNVSISQIVADLDTTIQGVQLAITAYTLVMAALMLAGAKLGDIIGRDKTFALGLAIYGVGSLTTALSPNLAVLESTERPIQISGVGPRRKRNVREDSGSGNARCRDLR